MRPARRASLMLAAALLGSLTLDLGLPSPADAACSVQGMDVCQGASTQVAAPASNPGPGGGPRPGPKPRKPSPFKWVRD